MRWHEVVGEQVAKELFDHVQLVQETATAGSTMASNFPSMASAGGLGAGFDPNGDHGIYQKDRKKRGKLPAIIRRANP